MDGHLLRELEARALSVRCDVVRMMGMARSDQLASSLSASDILVWLYGAVLSVRPDEPLWEGRDRFVPGKASVGPVLYAVLAERGFFKRDMLWGYRRLGSMLQAFADFRRTPGVDVSCGSPGMGPGISLGLALALSDRNPAPCVFCLIGDGELREGAVWEALMASARHRPRNLIVIVDRNELQTEGTTGKTASLEPLEEKFEAFGWAAVRADGHDMESLSAALASLPGDRARVIVAKTVRGKGIPSLERATDSVRLDRQTTDRFLRELQGRPPR
ncbi:MAG: transketolase [Synergistaceae bacterium]|jgi:transketolase|nr:transketolase [Synergistaceae bacterium]